MSSSLVDRYDSVRRILRTKRSEPTTVCGVVKKQDPKVIEQFLGFGMRDLGVNYTQEGEKLRTQFTDPSIRWHFIGHIQSRKVKALADYDVVQSLDRLDIAAALNQQVEPRKKILSVLVQVNIGEEPQKSGVSVHELKEFLKKLNTLPFLKPAGLMALPPGLEDVERRRPYFKRMKSLYDEYKETFPFETLSMGTSEDFVIAAEEGANFVRLGTVLFGSRV